MSLQMVAYNLQRYPDGQGQRIFIPIHHSLGQKTRMHENIII
jgi:hypothetical protein